MPFPSSQAIAKAAIQDMLDLVNVDGLPEDKYERRETLRFLAKSDTWVPSHCPETGVDLSTVDIVAHAQTVYPDGIPASRMSPEAREREASLYRAAGVKPPVRR
jgi:hypothetical protein